MNFSIELINDIFDLFVELIIFIVLNKNLHQNQK